MSSGGTVAAWDAASLRNKMVLGLVLGALVYLGISFYVGWEELAEAAQRFNWWILPGLLALSLVNYIVRFLKWHYYLGRLEIELGYTDSVLIFLSGLMLSITPGKLGELIKAVLVKMRLGTRVSTVAPVVFAERLTDVMALVIISVLGALGHTGGQHAVLAGALVVVAGLALVSSRPLVLGLLHRLAHLRWVGRNLERIELMYESAFALVSPVPLAIGTVLSLVAWGAECVAFGWTFAGFGHAVDLGSAAFAYAVSTLVGALSMLPGGLGTTEASLAAFAHRLFGAPEGVAGLAAIIVRLTTLWFAVGLGAVAMLAVSRRFSVDDQNSTDGTAAADSGASK